MNENESRSPDDDILAADETGSGGEVPPRDSSDARDVRDVIDWPEGERPLLPFAPMIYVAWADGVLTPAELREIRDRIRTQPWLDDRARAALDRWLDPDSPPDPETLAALRLSLREIGAKLPEPEHLSLAELGIELARAAGAEDDGHAPEVAEALLEVEAALGAVDVEAMREIFGEAPQEPARREERAKPAASFDIDAMGRYLDGDRRRIRDEVFAVLADPVFRWEPHLPIDEHRRRVFEWLGILAARGLGSVAFPEEYGGRGDIAGSIYLFETLAFFDLSLLVKFGVHFGLFGGSILSLGTRRHHERYLRDVIELRLPGCYAMTEGGHGSNVRDIETTATYDAKTREFVIHTPTRSAYKDWIGNAALHGRMATVFAQLDVGGERHGVHAFLVPLRDEEGRTLPGIRIEDIGAKVGLNGVDNGRIWFDNVRIPRENLLDRFGSVSEEGGYTSPIPSPGRRFFTMLGTLVAGRISIAAASVSAAKSGLTFAVRYTDQRRQFGPAGGPEVPVLDYRTMQRRLLPRLATTYALDFACRDLIEMFAARVEAGELREVETLAAGIKAYASWHTVETLQHCREACGGQGYLAANRIGELRADTDVFTTFEGDNTVLLQLVARSLLTDYREELGELQLWGALRFVTRRATIRVAELNPIVTRRTDPDHLRDPAFHRAALRWRESRLLSTAARRLKRRLDGGVDPFAAMNQTQDHLVDLAHAHIERVILERFQDAVRRCPPGAERRALTTLCELFALSRIEADRGWFLETGYLEPVKSKAIRDRVSEVCEAIRPDAVGLVDGFGIRGLGFGTQGIDGSVVPDTQHPTPNA